MKSCASHNTACINIVEMCSSTVGALCSTPATTIAQVHASSLNTKI